MDDPVRVVANVIAQIFGLLMIGGFGWVAGSNLGSLKRPRPWITTVLACMGASWFFVDGRVADPDMGEWDGVRNGESEQIEVETDESLLSRRIRIALWMIAAVSGGMVISKIHLDRQQARLERYRLAREVEELRNASAEDEVVRGD